MPTSETGRWTERGAGRRPVAGFTLVELLVVISVLGIVLAMVTLSFNRGGRDDAVRDAARRLQLVCRALADEAVYRARPLGLDLGANGYRVLEFRAGQWRERSTATGPGATVLAAGLELNTTAGGTFAAGDTPDLVLLPDGNSRLRPVIVGDRHSRARARLEPLDGTRLFDIVSPGATP